LIRDRPEASVTVTDLCRLARSVAKLAISLSLPDSQKASRPSAPRPQVRASKGSEIRRAPPCENIGLRADIAKFAALVDHYYAAYRETTVLLERRDRELAVLRDKLQLRSALLPSAGRKRSPWELGLSGARQRHKAGRCRVVTAGDLMGRATRVRKRGYATYCGKFR
jgi:hypothetical protein